MKIHPFEKLFVAISAVLLGLGLVAIGATVFAAGIHLPAPHGRIDPTKLASTVPFDSPGLQQTGPIQYNAVIVAQVWQFTPFPPTTQIEIPAGSTVTFTLSSSDVVHGFMIQNTDVNAMVIPGEITQVTHTFDRPGEYLIICHEYCGIGHDQMFGKVLVA
jgi:cytochrome c oxidase subunit 2